MLSNLRQDLERYATSGRSALLDPSVAVIVSYRLGQWCRRSKVPIAGPVFRALHAFLHAIITLIVGIYLPRSASIGPGLRIYHFGGIVISPNAVIGRNCTLRNNVCIGTRYGANDAPSI